MPYHYKNDNYDYDYYCTFIEMEVEVVLETKLLASESAVLKLLVKLHGAPHCTQGSDPLQVLITYAAVNCTSCDNTTTKGVVTLHYHLAADANGKLVSVENLQFNTVYSCNVSVYNKLYSHVTVFTTRNTLPLSQSE